MGPQQPREDEEWAKWIPLEPAFALEPLARELPSHPKPESAPRRWPWTIPLERPSFYS
jgi:hypothetical protein